MTSLAASDGLSEDETHQVARCQWGGAGEDFAGGEALLDVEGLDALEDFRAVLELRGVAGDGGQLVIGKMIPLTALSLLRRTDESRGPERDGGHGRHPAQALADRCGGAFG